MIWSRKIKSWRFTPVISSPKTGEVIVKSNEEIDKEAIGQILAAGIRV